jgi:ubiquinone/menaquinone biosynthesis C-methylase UbiE
MKHRILHHVGSANSCIDIACGDDRGVFHLAHKVPLVVANDIAVDQIVALEREYYRGRSTHPKSHSLFFTNHDCLDLPFRENAFDIALCRNLLHHMQAARDLTALLGNMRRVARRMLVVEVEDPSDGSIWAQLRHKYYLDWLKDGGRHFYKRSDFEHVIAQHSQPGDIVRYEYLPTIRGTYMIAEVIKG